MPQQLTVLQIQNDTKTDVVVRIARTIVGVTIGSWNERAGIVADTTGDQHGC